MAKPSPSSPTKTLKQLHGAMSKPGRVTDEGVLVKAGLKPGEILITGGVQFLQNGMKVRLPKQAATEVAQVDGTVSR